MHYDRDNHRVVVSPDDIQGLTAEEVFAQLPLRSSATVIVHFKDFLEPTLWSREDLQRTLDKRQAACHERDILRRLKINYKLRLPTLPEDVAFYRTLLFSGDGENLAVMVSLTESDLMRIARHLHCQERDREVHSIALVNSGELNAHLRAEQNRQWQIGQEIKTDVLYRVTQVGVRHNHIVTFGLRGQSSFSKIGDVTVENEHHISLRSRQFFQSTRFRPKRQGPKPIRVVQEPSMDERTEVGDFSASYGKAIRNASQRQNPTLPPAHEEDADRARCTKR